MDDSHWFESIYAQNVISIKFSSYFIVSTDRFSIHKVWMDNSSFFWRREMWLLSACSSGNTSCFNINSFTVFARNRSSPLKIICLNLLRLRLKIIPCLGTRIMQFTKNHKVFRISSILLPLSPSISLCFFALLIHLTN